MLDKVLAYMLLIAITLFAATSFSHAVAEELELENDTFCLAQNIYFEAGNQPLAGRIAVGQVTLNRRADNQFPDSICDVVYQAKMKSNWRNEIVPIRNQCQFSWFCDGKSDIPTDSLTWIESLWLADKILDNLYPDFTEGALWYHNDSVTPYWSKQLNRTVTIDNHLFYN